MLKDHHQATVISE